MQSPASTSGRTRAWKWTAPARRVRLAQCEPSATQSTPPRAVRAQRDGIHLSAIRAIPPGAMRAQVTSPKRLPGASVRLPPGAGRSEDRGRLGDSGPEAPWQAGAGPGDGENCAVGAVRSGQGRSRSRQGREASAALTACRAGARPIPARGKGLTRHRRIV